MDRFLSAVLTFVGVLFAQIFAVAATETFARVRLDLFGSRGALFNALLAISLAAAILRWRKGRRVTTPPRTASPLHGPDSSRAAVDELARRASGPDAASATARAATPEPSQTAQTPRAAEMLAAQARQAIVFRQHFPPRHDPAIRSFFGGAPVAPRGMLWPRAGSPASQAAPLHFLLQVDCSEVPAAARLGALPDRGVLYFFLDLSWETFSGRVLHADGRFDQWETMPPPADLGPAHGKQALYDCGWAQTLEQCPALLPKWTFDPIVVELPEPRHDDEHGDEEDEPGPALWPERAAGELLLQAQGDTKRYDYLTIRDVIDGQSVKRPFDAFPHDWRALQICSVALLRQVDRERRHPTPSTLREMDEEAKAAALAGVTAQAQAWFDRAASQPPFDEVPRAERDEFWELVARHPSITRYGLTEALTRSIEASLAHSEQAAARIPAELSDRIRGRHALAVMTDNGLHANIPDRMLAPPVDVQGNQWERAQTHLLLLELSSNEGIGHHFGEGVFQFWIRPQDLEAGRFDKVEITSDAY